MLWYRIVRPVEADEICKVFAIKNYDGYAQSVLFCNNGRQTTFATQLLTRHSYCSQYHTHELKL